ncbi:MAG: DUF5007 domain-containing protein [Pedobacter sp.]|nr:MAG: DUF5007 domain-containing protein [Pedobacter sp.]
MQNKIKYSAFIFLTSIVVFSGCKKIFDLPEEKDYLSTKATYTTTVFEPILGRTTIYRGIFNADNSSFPMKFEIVNARYGDGRPADELFTMKDVLVWTSEYTGRETSLAEIEAKRKVEKHPLIELRTSGDLIVWNSATSDIITPRDSITYPQDIRYFDVKVSNSGGSRIIKDLQFNPYIERPYSPDADINPFNGRPNTSTPGGKTLVRNYPGISGMVGASTNAPMNNPQDPTRGLVYTYIRKFEGGTGNSLRFKFLDRDSAAINPAKFNETRWDELVHGFNKVMTDEYVQYDVAYPIPVAPIPTKYTTGGINADSGNEAFVRFAYSRIGFGGNRETGQLTQSFRIFEKGDWEIVFHFKTVNPKFENE